MSQVAILIPLMRPHLLAPLVQNIAETTTDYRIVVLATGECAEAARTLPVTLIEDDGGTWPERVNRGYRATTEPYIFTGADDIWFHEGWFEAAMRCMEQIQGGGVVAVNDLLNMAGVHFLISKSYIETLGGVMDEPPGVVACEQYRHAYVDDDLRSTAIFHDRWGHAMDSIVEHRHPGAGKAPTDEIYAIGEASMTQGVEIYMSRGHLWAN